MKILTWNIQLQSTKGKDIKYIPDFVADELIYQNADIIVLTEFVRVSNWDIFLHEKLAGKGYKSFYLHDYTLKEIQKHADEYAKNEPKNKNKENVKGHINEILVAIKKGSVKVKESENNLGSLFAEKGFNANNLPNFLRVDLELADKKTLTIVGTRIRSGNPGHQREQLDGLLNHLDKIRNPVIAIGDFNAGSHYTKKSKWNWNDVFESDKGYLQGEKKYQLKTPAHGFSNVNRGNLNSIDHIISKGLEKEEIEISNLNYSWEFMSRDEEYRYDSKYPNFYPKVCFPDHAILTANIEIIKK